MSDDQRTPSPSPKWTVLSLTESESSTWIGTCWEFFEDEAAAQARYEELEGLKRCPTLRPFYGPHDGKHLGAGHDWIDSMVAEDRHPSSKEERRIEFRRIADSIGELPTGLLAAGEPPTANPKPRVWGCPHFEELWQDCCHICNPKPEAQPPEECPRCHWPQVNHPTKEYREGEYVYVLHTITCPAHEGWTPPGEPLADEPCRQGRLSSTVVNELRDRLGFVMTELESVDALIRDLRAPGVGDLRDPKGTPDR